jgi:hypothetical protein
MDPGEIARLLGQGGILISDLERLLGDLEQFAGRVVQGMSIDLAFTGRQIDKMAIQPIGRGIIKDPIPPRQNPRETIPIPNLKPKPNVMAIAEFASGLLITTPGNIPGLSNILRNSEAPESGTPVFTPWGWSGSPSYRRAVGEVNTPGTHETIGGVVPSQDQAMRLIREGGGTVVRVEEGHEPPNPHVYPHINYTTSDGQRATVQIQEPQ